MLAKLLIAIIELYQKFISPFIGHHCRFHPTCSSYAVESLKMHGIIRGSFLSLLRIIRCGPWSQGGMDPVPPTAFDKKNAYIKEVFHG